MFRRFATALFAVFVLAVVTAGPAAATTQTDPGSSPVASGSGSGGATASGGDSGSGSDNGTGTSTSSGTTTDPTQGSSSSGKSDGTSSSNGKGAKGKDAKAGKATPTPKASTAAPRTATRTVAPTYEAPSSSVVRASAAPAATDSGITTTLPAPNPMLLPETVTNASAPVDAEHSSSLPQALPALLIGAGVLSVAVGGTLFARRRMLQGSTLHTTTPHPSS